MAHTLTKPDAQAGIRRWGPWAAVALAVVAIGWIWLNSSQTVSAHWQPQIEPTPATAASVLLYLQGDVAGAPEVKRGPGSAAALAGATAGSGPALAAPSVPAGCDVAGQWAAPRGGWLAQQISCEYGGYVRFIQTATGQLQSLPAEFGPDSIFLSWSPVGSEALLKTDIVGTPRIYAFNVNDGAATQLALPDTVYDLALSADGRRMVYSLTRGLGYGSETWLAEAGGRNARRILADPAHIVAYARFSPDGQQISYILMQDSNIPFTVGELWLADGNGGNAVKLGAADAGHGYEPVWSPDGTQLAFVGRENKDDVIVDQAAERLISNIYLVTVATRQAQNLTRFNGALTENPVWSPDGAALAFNTTAGGQGMDVWVADAQSGQLRQLTHGAAARYPVWAIEPH